MLDRRKFTLAGLGLSRPDPGNQLFDVVQLQELHGRGDVRKQQGARAALMLDAVRRHSSSGARCSLERKPEHDAFLRAPVAPGAAV